MSKEGYVYIFINPLIDGVVKIGKTTRSSESRAAEISKSTGVPVAYKVVHEEFVSDCVAVEKRLHKMFSDYRINPNREFFRIPLKEAVRALQQVANVYRVANNQPIEYNSVQAVEILPRLQHLYPKYLKPEIKSVQMIQRDDICFLEITSQAHPNIRDEKVERIDLEFIAEEDGTMFPINRSVQENANKFVNKLDPYSIIMCTPLFTEAACRKIADEYENNTVLQAEDFI
ncbi:GIY-YIG nuclease family protein [Nostoc sp. FACHB-110]|uniref:GIY-YIG nuclease family protein n=1 Tax=Nostoc sp. FACHB-110 TaxID=2692834 RepID=UPI0016873BC4|nr:GIY-YIG nuclease family protein [Nostoc sp. FACHB-110]MBD2436455.1 GIY-YIG nuclease family protein [Nostoc sp. FACHB-110]